MSIVHREIVQLWVKTLRLAMSLFTQPSNCSGGENQTMVLTEMFPHQQNLEPTQSGSVLSPYIPQPSLHPDRVLYFVLKFLYAIFVDNTHNLGN